LGLSDIFKKQKYVFRSIFNGNLVSRKKEAVKGQTAFYLKKAKMAYLIPPGSPIKENNMHVLDYDIGDATPLSDIIDVAPDLVRQVEKQIAANYIQAIDLTLKDPDNLLRDFPLNDKQREEMEKAKVWLKSVPGRATGILYNLFRWGYLKSEHWYNNLVYIPPPEALVFPKQYVRVGVNPKFFFALEKSTMATDIIRRQEPKWAWLEALIIPILIFAVIIIVAILVLK